MSKLSAISASCTRTAAEYHAEALRWYRRAAEQGNYSVHNNLGCMYECGHGVQQHDDVKVLEMYRKAAKLGYAGAKSTVLFLDIKLCKQKDRSKVQLLRREVRRLGHCRDSR
jgi:TPR repeat protein